VRCGRRPDGSDCAVGSGALGVVRAHRWSVAHSESARASECIGTCSVEGARAHGMLANEAYI
jgi:hypothetical protein